MRRGALAAGLGVWLTGSGLLAQPRAECGNGRVEPGELCDPNVRWEARCPAPWGLCWVCSPRCNARVLWSSDLLAGVTPAPFCEERHTGGLVTTRTYDARGHVLTSRAWSGGVASVHGRYVYDAEGRPIEEHTSVRGGAEEHMFRAYGPEGMRRTWLDRDLDGTPERVWRFETTPSGRLRRMWIDAHDGRPPEQDRRYTYDADGNLIADVSTFADAGWHDATVFAYDALGRELFYGHTGDRLAPDIECRARYFPGGSVRACTWVMSDGASLVRRVVSDALGGRVRSYERAAGRAPEVTHFASTHDPRGLLVREATRDARGRLARVEHHRYDASGVEVETREGRGAVTMTRDLRCLAAVIARAPWRRFAPR